MDETTLGPSLELAVRTFVKERIEPCEEGHGFLAITSRIGNTMRLVFEDARVDVEFGLSGDGFRYAEAEDEKDLLAKVLKFVLGVTKEELVSVRYSEFSWYPSPGRFLRYAMVPVSELDKYRKKKDFSCVSWNDTHSHAKPADDE